MESRWSFEIERPSEGGKQTKPFTETNKPRPETQKPIDELQLAYYRIDKAVARTAKQPDGIVGRPNSILELSDGISNSDRRLGKAANLWKEKARDLAAKNSAEGKEAELDHQQVMDRSESEAAGAYRDRRMFPWKKANKLALLDKLSQEQKRQPLSLEGRTLGDTEKERNTRIFQEKFENRPPVTAEESQAAAEESQLKIETYRKTKKGFQPDPSFVTRFDTKNGDTFIEAARVTKGDELHLSDILSQQRSHAEQIKPIPKTSKVTVETIHNVDTALAMKYCGSGTFEKGSHQFNIMQESVFVKAIRHLQHDNRDSFAGNELTRITVDARLSRIEGGDITCEFH